MSGQSAFLALWASFPCLEHAMHIDGEQAGQPLPPAIEHLATLDKWGAKFAGAGGKQAAAFILAVWDNRATREVGHFDLLEAMRVWDADNRRAFAAWVERPFRP
jgi:hypothetical protein